jgi:hypothetical protein
MGSEWLLPPTLLPFRSAHGSFKNRHSLTSSLPATWVESGLSALKIKAAKGDFRSCGSMMS